jgi:hypothetical protein
MFMMMMIKIATPAEKVFNKMKIYTVMLQNLSKTGSKR